MKYGSEVFEELKDLQDNGFMISGIMHEIEIVCCCDWKAGACLEGNMLFYKYRICLYCILKIGFLEVFTYE